MADGCISLVNCRVWQEPRSYYRNLQTTRVLKTATGPVNAGSKRATFLFEDEQARMTSSEMHRTDVSLGTMQTCPTL